MSAARLGLAGVTRLTTRKSACSGARAILRAKPAHEQAQPISEIVRALLEPPRTSRCARGPPEQLSRRLDLPDLYEGLVTPQQAAELFDVTQRTIRNWQRAGKITPVRVGGRVFYRLGELLGLVGR